METNIKRSERRKSLRLKNKIIYGNDNIIAGCENLNQTAEWLEKKYPCCSEDERDFMKNIFKNTYAGEVIKLIEKKMNKKTKKKPKVVR
jgi:exonuclease III